MQSQTICIVGGGYRGISVYERLIAFANAGLLPSIDYHVHIVDPGWAGVGIHKTDQPDYLSLNTVCGQLTIFTDEKATDAGPVNPGPNLYEWAVKEGYQLSEEGFAIKNGGRKIKPSDNLPRRLLGEYLHWGFYQLLRQTPANITVRVYAQHATRYERNIPGKHRIYLEDNTLIQADYLFLTTGHTPNVRKSPPFFSKSHSTDSKYITDPYPVNQKLAKIQPKESVAILGCGLTANDVIASQTIGRGGQYIADPVTGNKKYIPSGNEPQILLTSTSGIPYRTRPVIADDNIYDQYHPVLFTKAAIDQRRAYKQQRTNCVQLDFEQEVLPLLVQEMYLAYYQGKAKEVDGPFYAGSLYQLFHRANLQGTLGEFITCLKERYGDPQIEQLIFSGMNQQWEDRFRYERWFFDFVRDDLREAQKGKAHSPLKKALDLFRDLRAVIRYAVDFGGLTPQSHAEFFKMYSNLINRTVIGPSIKQSAQLLALFEAGIVSASCGPSPHIEFDEKSEKYLISSTKLKVPFTTQVDWLCHGYVEQPSIDNSASPFLRSLYHGNHVRPYKNGNLYIGGIDLNRHLQPINSDGVPETGLWVLGPLSEGVRYYNHYVASPLSGSLSQLDAGSCVKQMLNDIKRALQLIQS